MNYLGIDYGEHRVGIAFADSELKWAFARETNPYDWGDDYSNVSTIARLDVPMELSIYATGWLRLNDGVDCETLLRDTSDFYLQDRIWMPYTKGKCFLGSNDSVGYSVVLGTKTKVHGISTKGRVFLRNGSEVQGNIRFYHCQDSSYCLQKQQRAKHHYGRVLFRDELYWPYAIQELPPMEDVGQREVRVKYGEVLTLQSGDKFKKLSVAPGGTLRVPMGEFHFGELQMDASSQIEYMNSGYKSVFHLNGPCIWRAKLKRQNNVKDSTIARGVKLMQHGSETMFIEGEWAGTILAPNADLVLGQSNKIVYGRFAGKNVTVHQYAVVKIVPFNPTALYEVVFLGGAR